MVPDRGRGDTGRPGGERFREPARGQAGRRSIAGKRGNRPGGAVGSDLDGWPVPVARRSRTAGDGRASAVAGLRRSKAGHRGGSAGMADPPADRRRRPRRYAAGARAVASIFPARPPRATGSRPGLAVGSWRSDRYRPRPPRLAPPGSVPRRDCDGGCTRPRASSAGRGASGGSIRNGPRLASPIVLARWVRSPILSVGGDRRKLGDYHDGNSWSAATSRPRTVRHPGG